MFSSFQQLIGGQDEDSCGKSGTGETPQERKSASDEEAHRPPAESEVLHGNQLRCNKQSLLAYLFYLFPFRFA
ncbi:hypothetical protein [Priestia megaterium]|uniref:hypothetical protein n=1 Tax=Priestia megaterium TaxID=1404 RepID=UPI0004B2626B|nr:hypothetical protein [Priestia megaterium]